MLNVLLTPNPEATGMNEGVAGGVLLTPAFFVQFPDVRFFIRPPGRVRKATYKYVNALEEVEEVED
jgi:hypothetical protein